MIYLLYGINDFLINEELNKIIIKYKLNKDDICKYDLSLFSIKNIIDDALSLPLFNNKKIIIAENCTIFDTTGKKEDGAILEKYIENVNESTILIFIDKNEKLDERKKITKKMKEKYQCLECNKINIYQVAKELFEDYIISPSTLNKLINRVGSNLYNLKNEIEKLKIFKINDKIINDEDILFTCKTIDDNIFNFIDYIVLKNSEKVLEIYNEMIKKNVEPIMMIVMIANQFRLLYQVKELYTKNNSLEKIASILEIHPYRVKLAFEKSKNYSANLLLEYLEKLADLDVSIKSGNIEPDIGLELFLLGI
ncbi:MAG: DNA polymerase III subunit delta [Bacilli bacterium]